MSDDRHPSEPTGEVIIALGYPHTRSVAGGNLGFAILDRLVRATASVRPMRFFVTPELRNARTRGVAIDPPTTRLAQADLVLLSLSYEGDAPAAAGLLAAGGLPPLAAERRRGHPLVVGGGALVMINPEPLASLFDLFLVGEAEALWPLFWREWVRHRLEPREQLLGHLDETVPGAMAPRRRPHRLWVMGDHGLTADRIVTLSGARAGSAREGPHPAQGSAPAPADRATELPAPSGTVVDPDRPVERVFWAGFGGQASTARLPDGARVGQSYLVELSRGCPRTCRFCAATRIYAPFRECPEPVVLERARREVQPEDVVGLLGLSAGDYSRLPQVAAGLAALGARLSISSLPPGFARQDAGRLLVNAGARTLTIAPETGSERLRALIGKPVGDGAILSAVETLGGLGLGGLRTYFLIGLPFEKEDDVRAIGRLLARMRERLPRACGLSATVNAFVPKPRTPFQWAAMAPLARLRAHAARLRRDLPRGVSLRIKSFREARTQAWLARGDSAWGPRLLRMAAEGCRPETVLRTAGPGPEALLGAIGPGAPVPWGYLMDAAERDRLEAEWAAAVVAGRTEA